MPCPEATKRGEMPQLGLVTLHSSGQRVWMFACNSCLTGLVWLGAGCWKWAQCSDPRPGSHAGTNCYLTAHCTLTRITLPSWLGLCVGFFTFFLIFSVINLYYLVHIKQHKEGHSVMIPRLLSYLVAFAKEQIRTSRDSKQHQPRIRSLLSIAHEVKTGYQTWAKLQAGACKTNWLTPLPISTRRAN